MNNRDCKHGHLARVCEICFLEAENAAWKTLAKEMAEAVKYLRQTVHQAYHEGSCETCPKNTCDTANQALTFFNAQTKKL